MILYHMLCKNNQSGIRIAQEHILAIILPIFIIHESFIIVSFVFTHIFDFQDDNIVRNIFYFIFFQVVDWAWFFYATCLVKIYLQRKHNS